jgi:hypothetical protein
MSSARRGQDFRHGRHEPLVTVAHTRADKLRMGTQWQNCLRALYGFQIIVQCSQHNFTNLKHLEIFGFLSILGYGIMTFKTVTYYIYQTTRKYLINAISHHSHSSRCQITFS